MNLDHNITDITDIIDGLAVYTASKKYVSRIQTIKKKWVMNAAIVEIERGSSFGFSNDSAATSR
jgi:hypothetical protein